MLEVVDEGCCRIDVLFFILYEYGDHRDLHSFPTRRSSDLEFVMKAPVKPGEYAWLAVSPAVVKEGVSYIQASAPISFTVKPHTTFVVTWDTPSAVVI